MLVAHVRTSRVCRAKTSFIVQRSSPTFAEVKSLGYLSEISRSISEPYVSANAEWCRIGITFISITTRRAERNSFLARVVSLVVKRSKPYFLMGERGGSAERM